MFFSLFCLPSGLSGVLLFVQSKSVIGEKGLLQIYLYFIILLYVIFSYIQLYVTFGEWVCLGPVQCFFLFHLRAFPTPQGCALLRHAAWKAVVVDYCVGGYVDAHAQAQPGISCPLDKFCGSVSVTTRCVRPRRRKAFHVRCTIYSPTALADRPCLNESSECNSMRTGDGRCIVTCINISISFLNFPGY